jgi:hypothetical protein
MSCEYVVERGVADLPQSTTETLFTVTGLVLIEALVGEVTADTDAIPTTQGIVGVGDQSPWVGNVQGVSSGSVLGYQDSDLTSTEVGPGVNPIPRHPMVMTDGSAITFETNHSIAGQIAWTLVYRPLLPGSQVVAD